MWQEIRAGEFPTHACLHAICPTAFDPLQAPRGKHAASVFMPVPFQLKGKKPEDWVKLKNGFHGQRFQNLAPLRDQSDRREHRNESGHGAALYVRPLAQHAPRFGLGGAQDCRPKWASSARSNKSPTTARRSQGLYQVGVAMHPADAVIAGSGYNCWRAMKQDLKL